MDDIFDLNEEMWREQEEDELTKKPEPPVDNFVRRLPRFTYGECGGLACIYWGDGKYVWGFPKKEKTKAIAIILELNKKLRQNLTWKTP